MREFARGFYKSSAWRKCRQAYIVSVHGLCERCSAGGKIVHHKIYLNEQNIHDVSVTLNHEHLELLCQECHNIEHMHKGAISKGLLFDSNGNIKKII
jgi:5-methylcytosine-specific restriction endonuclease McrA